MLVTINKLSHISYRLSQEYGQQPTAKELAAEMQTSPKKVDRVLNVIRQPLSLETPIGEETSSSLGDFIEDKTAPQPAEAAINKLLKVQLQDALASLSTMERRVIEMRFGLDGGYSHTLDEMGLEFGLSKERIRQIQNKALQKLRQPKVSRILREYLE